ncbi:MAG: multidrug efflux MFS transporter [Dehalococcoidia bacterium]|nr:multidrug efflux MFS transporter [Dehalococcoidia bacterium]
MKRFEYKWVVAVVMVIGLFMELLDMTIVNVALPGFARDFEASATTIQWIVTGYLLSLAVVIPLSGWAGDRYGTKRTFMFALTVFTSGSLLCALAQNAEQLIAFRVVQGVGGGMLTPVGTAMLFRAFPPNERSKASALLAIPASMAPAMGPVVGGYLVEYHSWHWIFLINIPIGLAGLAISALYLDEHRELAGKRLDVPGFVLSAGGLAALIYGLSEAGDRGFEDPRALGFMVGGLVTLTVFVLLELRTAQPMLNVRLFTNRLFATNNAVQFVAMAGFSGVLFILPLLLQAERGLTPLQSGLTTFPMALGVLTFAPFVGRIYPRVGPRRLMVAGLIVGSLSAFVFVWIDLETSQWWIRAIMYGRGVGFALMLVPLQAATFATISNRDTGEASAMFNVGRQVASSFGVALLATVLTRRLVEHGGQLGNPATRDASLSAFHDAFVVSGLIIVIGVAAAFLVRDHEAAASMQRTERAAATAH